jgi:hypothetical protein
MASTASPKRARKSAPKRRPAAASRSFLMSDEHLKQVVKQAVHEALQEHIELLDRDSEAWDRQFEADVRSGKLDALADQALEELHQGKAKDL